MGFIDKAQEFLIGRMLKKAAVAGIVALGGSKIVGVLAAHGVSVSIDPDMASAAVVAAAAGFFNWLKNRKKGASA